MTIQEIITELKTETRTGQNGIVNQARLEAEMYHGEKLHWIVSEKSSYSYLSNKEWREVAKIVKNFLPYEEIHDGYKVFSDNGNTVCVMSLADSCTHSNHPWDELAENSKEAVQLHIAHLIEIEEAEASL